MTLLGDTRMLVWLPVRVRRGQHELEVHGTGPVLQLVVLEAVQLIGDVPPADVHLERGERG